MIGAIADLERLTEIAGEMKRKYFKPGFDNMDVPALIRWMNVNGPSLSEKIRDGRYRPMPAIGFYTAKKDGGFRSLARLTAIDSMIQRSMVSVIGAYCETRFSPSSYAFRRGKGTRAAVEQFCALSEQYSYAVKIDPVKCFDRFDRSVLMKTAEEVIREKSVVQLIAAMAEMPVMSEGELKYPEKGVIQGAPLSSLLCNLYFHPLDRLLEEKQIPFVRYADDIAAFAVSEEQARDLYEEIASLLKNVLLLDENPKKTRIGDPADMTYLGRKFHRKDGAVFLREEEPDHAVYLNWYDEKPLNPRRRVDLFEDGILKQKDYAAVFESESGKTDIPIAATDVINLYSNVIFDSGFLKKAMESGIIVNLFDKQNRLCGRFLPNAPLKNGLLTLEQLSAQKDGNACLRIAGQFLDASVHNTRLVIRYYRKQDDRPGYTAALRKINILATEAKKCTTTDELRTVEARIREAYYACYDLFAERSGFSFRKRSRRPPENELNAMISFGNTVLYNLIAVEINKTALDVRVGFLHCSDRREESLNLDVAEIFKPLIVDRCVFSSVNLGVIRPEHFDRTNGGVYLNETGKKLFLRRFYEKLDSTQTIDGVRKSYMQLIREDIYSLIRHFRTGEEYHAFRQVR